jgi:hypothetical protein
MNLDDIIKGIAFGRETSPIPRCSKSSSVATQQKEKTCNWIVTEPGRQSFEVHCSPPASMSEVLDERPDGTTATPCEQKPVKEFGLPCQH